MLDSSLVPFPTLPSCLLFAVGLYRACVVALRLRRYRRAGRATHGHHFRTRQRDHGVCLIAGFGALNALVAVWVSSARTPGAHSRTRKGRPLAHRGSGAIRFTAERERGGREQARPSAGALRKRRSVGDGTRIWAFAHVLPGARIGRDCNICDHIFIENDVVVGDRVTVKCGVQLWDGVRLGTTCSSGPT